MFPGLLFIVGNNASVRVGEYALIAGGQAADSTQWHASTQRYIYVNGVTSIGALLNRAVSRFAGTSNYQFGVFAGGNSVNVVLNITQKYMFDSDTVGPFSTLSTATQWNAAAGNADQGVFDSGSDYAGNLERYGYSTDAFTPGGSLIQQRHSVSAVGNAQIALFGGGYLNNNTISAGVDVYDHASEVTTTGTNIRTRQKAAAAGTQDVGWFFGGTAITAANTAISTTDKYTYADNTQVPGTAMAPTRLGLAAAGNSEMAYISGGFAGTGNSLNSTSKYEYATDTRTAATSLITARTYAAAISSTPGGFSL